MLSRSSKQSQVEKLSASFSRSKATFLVNCVGLNVEKMTLLRKNLKKNHADIQVIRNTLSLLAMTDQDLLKETYEPFLNGPNAFVIAYQEVIPVAKIIDEFSKEQEPFQIKKAVFEGQILNSEDVRVLAQLPPHEILKAQFLGLLQAPLTKLLTTWKEVPQSFVRLLSVKKQSKK